MARTIFENIVLVREENATNIAFCQYTPIRFFEILWFEKGSGTLKINGQNIPYTDNQLFVFVPNDMYNLEIETPTTVTAIKFLKNLFLNLSHSNDRKEWFKNIETILNNTNRASFVSFPTEVEEQSMCSLLQIFSNEYHGAKNDVILKNTLHSILYIISRNISAGTSTSNSSKIQEILHYIHQHIDESERLSKKAIAEEFHLSENYIGQYFKAQMDISLKKYILNYKLKLAETRLKYTDLTFTEIAHELGFTDSSHFTKTFVSYKGMTPSSFRENTK